MTKLLYNLRQIEEPFRRERRVDVYDAILDSFVVGRDTAVEVSVEGKTPVYVRRQLERCIKARNLEGIVNAYLADRKLYIRK